MYWTVDWRHISGTRKFLYSAATGVSSPLVIHRVFRYAGVTRASISGVPSLRHSSIYLALGYLSVADPEDQLPGRNQTGAKRRKGRGVRKGVTSSCRLGSGKICEGWMQMVHSEPIFCRVGADFFPQKLCVIFAFRAPFYEDGSILSSCSRGWGLPEKTFENGYKWCILNPYYAEFVLIFSPKIVCNFCLQKLRSSIYVMQDNFHLSLRGSYKAKEGSFFYPLAVEGGGGWRGLPEKIFENGCKWCILNQFLPIACWSPQLCVIFAFKALIYVMPKIFFPFARGSPTPVFFVKNGCKWWILRPFKADWVLVFSWNYTFVIKSPDVQGMWCGSFPSFNLTGDYINMGGVGFFSCVGRIQGATLSPPPNILKNLCNIYSETIISRLNVCLK